MRYQKELIDFIIDLVSIPSMNGDEQKVLSRVEEEFKKLEYDKIWYDSLGNLFGQIGSGKRIIAIDGHLDTVDIGNPDNWKYDPFGAEIHEGVIHGRGTCDQKSGIAAAIYAGRLIKEKGIPDDISLIVCATVLEEDYEGISWKYILEEEGFIPEVVILTEPTNLEIKIGQRGRMEMKVHLDGISSHGSAPERGENAIYKSALILQEIEQLNAAYKSDSMLGKASITVTDIRSTAPSLCAVADSCTLHLDRRVTEGEDLISCIDEIRQLPSIIAQGAKVTIPKYSVKSYTGKVIPMEAYYPAWKMDESDYFVSRAVQSFRLAYDNEPRIDVWAFSTNGVWTMGMHNIPTIGFGPGNEAFAHTPEEHIEIDQIIQSVEFYTSFVLA